MTIAQIKSLTWLAAGLLTLGLSWYVFDFVRHFDERLTFVDRDRVARVLQQVSPVEIKQEAMVPLASINKNFHEFNWTGREKPAEAPPEAAAQDTTPRHQPVTEILRVLLAQLDGTDPSNGTVYVRYKQQPGGPAAPPPGLGEYLGIGDHLRAPNEHVTVAAITPEGVTFSFTNDAERAHETLQPDRFKSGPSIVVVDEQGVQLPVVAPIAQLRGAHIKPEETAQIGRDHYRIGTKDAAYFADHFPEAVNEVRHKRHRDPKTGKYDGVELLEVKPGSAAAKHGAQDGDIIKSINGHPVTSVQEAINFVKNNQDKYTVWEVVVESKGKTKTLVYESPGD